MESKWGDFVISSGFLRMLKCGMVVLGVGVDIWMGGTSARMYSRLYNKRRG